jgi:DNA-binding transcriptional MerR regulator
VATLYREGASEIGRILRAPQEESMLEIGEFSRLTGVSYRLLRLYDEIGLLKPSATDSGYRYYGAEQLGRLNRILLRRDLGFSLDEIARG